MTATNNSASSAAATDPSVRNRLWLMMFLLYAVYGLWFPIAARFLSASPDIGGLGFTDGQIGLIIAVAGAIGAVCAPFIAGQIADRYFSTEKCLGVLLSLGGAIKWYTGFQDSYTAWLWLSIAYAILFMPTLSMTNSLAMAHLRNSKREFPGVRVWGTIGWIVVAFAFPAFWLQYDVKLQWLPPFFNGSDFAGKQGLMVDSVKFAGILSIVLGVYCWMWLPNTPPRRDAPQKLAFAKAFSLVRHRSFAIYLCCAYLISVVHMVYFLQMSKFLPTLGLRDAYIMPAMALGQFSEIAVMAFLGAALTRFGFRRIIVIGAACYFLRYMVFGTTSLPLWGIITAQLFHGFCFAGFYAAGFIYVDRLAPKDARTSAQTVIMLVLFGLGPITAGKFVNPMLAKACTTANGDLNYSAFWYALGAVALVATIILALFFRDETESDASETKAESAT
jgi:MFS family permease